MTFVKTTLGMAAFCEAESRSLFTTILPHNVLTSLILLNFVLMSVILLNAYAECHLAE